MDVDLMDYEVSEVYKEFPHPIAALRGFKLAYHVNDFWVERGAHFTWTAVYAVTKNGYQPLLSKPVNQARRDVCWAIAASEAVSTMLKLYLDFDCHLAVQELIDLVPLVERHTYMQRGVSIGEVGDVLGHLDLALKYIKDFGLAMEKDYKLAFAFQRQFPPQQNFNMFKVKIGDVVAEKTHSFPGCLSAEDADAVFLNKIADLIHTKIVLACIRTYMSFMVLREEIYQGGEPGEKLLGYHALQVVGCGHETPFDYFLIKNSYGVEWGHEGYGRVRTHLLFNFIHFNMIDPFITYAPEFLALKFEGHSDEDPFLPLIQNKLNQVAAEDQTFRGCGAHNTLEKFHTPPPPLADREWGLTGERTVKRLRLSKALTVPETTTIYEACRRMAARRVDTLLLTDSNALVCGIMTDKDIAVSVIARETNIQETPVSKVMTRNPVFVLSDTHIVESLQKLVQGKFRNLPVVKNGEVIALLDIAKCLYDAIARVERAVEKGKTIVAAAEGVEKQWGASTYGFNTFIETIRERVFRLSLSTIVPDNSMVVIVEPSNNVLDVAKKMLESRTSSAIVTVESKPCGILTSKDILMRVIARDLSPESTLVNKVMSSSPECASVDTPMLDALRRMHAGKFLHMPVADKDGAIFAVVGVIHITRAAIFIVGSTAVVNDTSKFKHYDAKVLGFHYGILLTMMKRHTVKVPLKLASEGQETGISLPFLSSTLPNAFAFKIHDGKGRMRRFTSGLSE